MGSRYDGARLYKQGEAVSVIMAGIREFIHRCQTWTVTVQQMYDNPITPDELTEIRNLPIVREVCRDLMPPTFQETSAFNCTFDNKDLKKIKADMKPKTSQRPQPQLPTKEQDQAGADTDSTSSSDASNSDSSISEEESEEIQKLYEEHNDTKFASNTKKGAILHILAKDQHNASAGTVQCIGGCQLNKDKATFFVSLRHAMTVQQGWCSKAVTRQTALFQTLVHN